MSRSSSDEEEEDLIVWATRTVVIGAKGGLDFNNCRALNRNQVKVIQGYPCLTVQELMIAENYWILISQEDNFKEEVCSLTSNKTLPSKSCLLSLHPFLDSYGILRVCGREQNSKLSYSN